LSFLLRLKRCAIISENLGSVQHLIELIPGGCFPGGKMLVAGLRMREAIPPPLATRHHGVQRDYLSLTNSTKQRPSEIGSSTGEETPGPLWYPSLGPI
jgi:hypothetical protein